MIIQMGLPLPYCYLKLFNMFIGVSDETFYAQSQIMVEKIPEFSAESLCLRQGVLLVSEIMFPESKNIHSQIHWSG